MFANVFRFEPDDSTQILTALHLPIAMWVVVGAAYTGARWRSSAARMESVRFPGELFIYYVLIALGGGVFTALTVLMFSAVGVGVDALFTEWVMPCGAMGAVLVGAWLVEQRRGIVGDIAPMLARVFTPLFAVMLLALLAAMVLTGGWADMEREMVIGFDLLLALVLGLLLYTVSARDPQAPPNVSSTGWPCCWWRLRSRWTCWRWAAIGGRITEFGFTPNRTAALGENLVLLCNLAWSAWLYARFLRGRGAFAALPIAGRRGTCLYTGCGRGWWWLFSHRCSVTREVCASKRPHTEVGDECSPETGYRCARRDQHGPDRDGSAAAGAR